MKYLIELTRSSGRNARRIFRECDVENESIALDLARYYFAPSENATVIALYRKVDFLDEE